METLKQEIGIFPNLSSLFQLLQRSIQLAILNGKQSLRLQHHVTLVKSQYSQILDDGLHNEPQHCRSKWDHNKGFVYRIFQMFNEITSTILQKRRATHFCCYCLLHTKSSRHGTECMAAQILSCFTFVYQTLSLI